MKFKADRATLMKSLAHVQNVVEKRNTIPILANVLLLVKEGKLTIAATDLEIALVEEVAAEPLRDGAITVPAATLYEIVRRQPENAVIELDHPGGDAQLALRAGRYSTSLVALSVEEFPKLDAGKLSRSVGGLSYARFGADVVRHELFNHGAGGFPDVVFRVEVSRDPFHDHHGFLQQQQ